MGVGRNPMAGAWPAAFSRLNTTLRYFEDVIPRSALAQLQPPLGGGGDMNGGGGDSNGRPFELKLLAVLASDFEQVLLLDADNLPLRDPSDLFTWPAYTATGQGRGAWK